MDGTVKLSNPGCCLADLSAWSGRIGYAGDLGSGKEWRGAVAAMIYGIGGGGTPKELPIWLCVARMRCACPGDLRRLVISSPSGRNRSV